MCELHLQYSYILTAITCYDIPAVENGMIVYSSDTTSPYDHGTIAVYECETGYNITGGDSERICTGGSTQWNGTAPQCLRMF